jgi:hypothetical protein
MSPAPSPTTKLFTGPIAAAIVSALLGVLGGMTADRVAIGVSDAKLEAVSQRVTELSTQQSHYVSKDEFIQFESQITDMKADIRDIRDSLRRDR